MRNVFRTVLWKLMPAVLSVSLPGLAVSANDGKAVHDGAAAYETHCRTCHGRLDKSNAPFFPDLAHSAQKLSQSEFIAAVLRGRGRSAQNIPGEPGAHQLGGMPALGQLSDSLIATILNYLYQQLESGFDAVAPEDVARVREGAVGDTQSGSLSPQDLAQAASLYAEHCAGCHGLDRAGLSGGALDAATLKDQSPLELLATLHYGTAWGMPNWGTSEALSYTEMKLLTRYLKQDGPSAPAFTMANVRASWRFTPGRPDDQAKRRFEIPTAALFVSLLHDCGQIALIDSRNYRIHSFIDTHLAPNALALTPDGRFLSVLARSGHLTLVDLHRPTPEVIAQVRAGYSARHLALVGSARQPLLVVSAQGASTLTVFDARTLKPLERVVLDQQEQSLPRAGVIALQAVPDRSRLLVLLEGTRQVLELRLRLPEPLQVTQRSMEISIVPESISFDRSGRALLVVGQGAELALLDMRRRRELAAIKLKDWQGGGHSVALAAAGARRWILAAPQEARMLPINVNQQGRSKAQLQIGDPIDLPSAGSLHLAAHPASARLWSDLTLSGIPGAGSRVMRIDLTENAPVMNTLDLDQSLDARFAGASAIQPQYDPEGKRVWFTLWNRQDLPSAIAVLNDQTLAIETIIADDRLTTPVRTYSAAGLLGR